MRTLQTGLVVLLLAGLASAGDLNVIIGFKGKVDAKLVKKHGAQAGKTIGGLSAMTATIPASKIAKLRADPSVAYVEEDGFVTLLGKRAKAQKPGNGKGKPPADSSDDPPQITPWGITRVGDGGLTANTGSGIKVAVIDTGCDFGHPDLAANIKGSVDFTGSRKGAKDEHGHGTHVAGTIAAIDNTIGVIGVAPQAHIYVVRVLDRRGSGRWSDVADGITWTADNGMQIANMSIGGGHSSTVQSACSYAAHAGVLHAAVLLVGAAGNSGDGKISTTETSYPAAYPTVASIGATTDDDGLASFSNTGPTVEVCGPGVGVTSTFKNGGYQTWNGTSMACPHAVGVAALIWKEFGSTNAADVRMELQSRVDDLGDPGKDNGFGYGIVDFSNG